MNRYGGTYSHRVLDRMNLKYQNSWANPLPFKLTETVPDYVKLSKEKCMERAKAILGSKSLYEEIDRIYSPKNRKKYFGHPVHYLISAGDWEAARDIYELLLEALYTNSRLLSGRQTEFRKFRKGVYRDDRYRTVIRAAEGGVVIIEMKTEDDMGRFASDFHEFTKVTGEILEKHKKDTLFIFVEIMGKSFKSSDAMNNITGKADVIQITEGSGLKNHVYQAYKEQKTFKIEVTKCKNKPYEELKSMIGLTEAKKVIEQIISASRVMKVRERMGLNTDSSSLHMLFSGNPGTAKTTVARLIAQVLKDEGVLKSGKFVECGRQNLVARYVGWTAKTVEEKFKEAQGGVLFIDEAYSLVEDRNSFGSEAINTIIQLMENYRNEVIVIFAGYNEKMQLFLEQNEGLKSRIAFHLDFPDYNADELSEILNLMVKKREYSIDDNALEACHDIFAKAVYEENFGNGRYVRNLLEQTILRQSNRIIRESQDCELSKEEMCRIKKEDIREVPFSKGSEVKTIGFNY